MKSKRLIAAILALILLMLGGALAETSDANFHKTGLPIVDDPVTLTAIGLVRDASKPITTSEFYQLLEDKTHVKIEYTEIIDKVWPDKKGVLFTSGDLPDILIGDSILSATDVVKYGGQGLIIDLKELIHQYNPLLQKKMDSVPGLENAITTADGKIYGYPGLDNSPMQVSYPSFINKTWLDALNLPIPATTDELYETLKAFHTKDPNGNGKADEIPMTFFNNNCSDYFGAFGILDSYNPRNNIANHIGVADNQTKVVYTAITEQYKEAITYFSKLFQEGLIDPEAFSQDQSILDGKAKADPHVVGVLQGWRNTAWQTNAEDKTYVPLPPMKGPNGDQMFPSRYSANNAPISFGSAVITRNCKTPEIAARWIDEYYDPDFSYQMSLKQKFGVHAQKEADGTITPLKLRDDFDPNSITFLDNGHRIHNMTVADYHRATPLAAHIQQKINIDQVFLPYLKEKDTFPSVLYTSEEAERLTQLATDINGYADECYARWISSGGIEKDWDGYVAQLKSMGLDEFVSLYQQVLDRYNGK